jgi:N-acetyl-gamma-glutamyl-phosphate reductase
MKGYCDITIDSPDKIDYRDIDIAFFSTPDRVGMTIIKDFFDKKIPVIDYSGDFRFNRIPDYTIYARNKGMDDTHLSPEILESSVYGLPEKYRDLIAGSKVVGNPGCFAICMILGLLPAAEKGIIKSDTIICDGKTGVSGAGKSSGEVNLYPQRHENTNTYREGTHQHLVETENVINAAAKRSMKILFIPQIVPMNRGILVNSYAELNSDMETGDVEKLYSDFYADKPFVTITGESPHTAHVRGSNYCRVRPVVDKRTGKLFITSVIDNLLKGQSGNAVQNANIMMGFDETTGLLNPGFYP